jgi:hypothetical protein
MDAGGFSHSCVFPNAPPKKNESIFPSAKWGPEASKPPNDFLDTAGQRFAWSEPDLRQLREGGRFSNHSTGFDLKRSGTEQYEFSHGYSDQKRAFNISKTKKIVDLVATNTKSSYQADRRRFIDQLLNA